MPTPTAICPLVTPCSSVCICPCVSMCVCCAVAVVVVCVCLLWCCAGVAIALFRRPQQRLLSAFNARLHSFGLSKASHSLCSMRSLDFHSMTLFFECIRLFFGPSLLFPDFENETQRDCQAPGECWFDPHLHTRTHTTTTTTHTHTRTHAQTPHKHTACATPIMLQENAWPP